MNCGDYPGLKPADWFERPTGFAEMSYRETQARLAVEGRELASRVTGQRYGIGQLELAALRELRALVARLQRRQQLPTIGETVPGYEVASWYGIVAPAATPSAVIARLRGELSALTGKPEVAARRIALGIEPDGNSPQEFAAPTRGEMAKLGQARQVGRREARLTGERVDAISRDPIDIAALFGRQAEVAHRVNFASARAATASRNLRRSAVVLLTRFVFALMLLWCAQGVAQSWPSRPVRLIVPFPPGGTTDTVARLTQPHLQQSLGVPIVIDNRGGASGAIGAGIAARATPDGYSFLLVWDTHAINPSIIPNLPYDTNKDLAPMMLIGTSAMVIVAHPRTALRSLKDVIAAVRAKPGSLSYGTPGAGSIPHLVGALLANTTNTVLTHVPYKGGGPLAVDALAGHVPLAIGTVALLSPHVQAERLRALAVTSAKRVAHFPSVPTVAEDAVPGLVADSWWGMLAPARTPEAIVSRMHAEFSKALRTPALQERWQQVGLVVAASSPAEFGAFLTAETARWAKVVKDNRITIGE